MQFEIGQVYHVYNRGNDKQTIFFNEENYLYFLRKIRRLILPNCELLAYCLMPNHFHFLIYADERTIAVNDKDRNYFSEAIRKLLSQYTKAVNIQQGRTSSLFQQNTKAKLVAHLSCHEHRGMIPTSCHDFHGTIVQDSAINCFVYIHKNPFEIVEGDLSKWKFSSYLDYAGYRNGTLCNKEFAYSLLGFRQEEFLKFFE
jgi:putative transposase